MILEMRKLTHADMSRLRETGQIQENEVAFVQDDIVIAENLTTGEKRVVRVAPDMLLESRRQLLKG